MLFTQMDINGFMSNSKRYQGLVSCTFLEVIINFLDYLGTYNF